MKLDQKIQDLKRLTYTEVNEKNIIEKGKSIFDDISEQMGNNRSQFSDPQIELIDDLTDIRKVLKRFVEEQADFAHIATREEVDEVVGRLYEVVERVEGLAVEGRVNKEIRELVERKASLPHEAGMKKSSELQSAIRRLSGNSPPCYKCGKIMVLRDSEHGYFWGCSTFPTCFAKKSLTKKERDEIPD